MAATETYLILMSAFLCTVPGCNAVYKTACLEGGQPAGEGLYDKGLLPDVIPGAMYLMKDTGAINCYGVIREWKYFKVGPCEAANFFVWRSLIADEYALVGRNKYEPALHGCSDTVDIVTFGVRGDEQIPVEPGDIIGWAQLETGGMISTTNSTLTQLSLLTPGNPGVTHPSSDFTEIKIEISLQAIVTRCKLSNLCQYIDVNAFILAAVLPLFSTLPREQNITEGYSKLTYNVKAVHPTNIMPQRSSSVMDDPVEITYNLLAHQDKFTIGLTDGKVEAINDVYYEAGNIYEIPVAASAMAMTATATLTITVTERQKELTIKGPSDVFISALDKRQDDEVSFGMFAGYSIAKELPRLTNFQVFRVFLDTYTGEKDVKFYFDHSYPYNLISPKTTQAAPPFYVDENTGIIKSVMDLTKYVHDNSYLETATFQLNVIATDGVLWDGQTVSVTISHLRKKPSFANLPHSIRVTEEVVAMTEIFQSEITSTYPTEAIHYELFSVVPEENFDSFQIDSQTGRVWIRDGHDLIREEDYVLSISAQDIVNATTTGQLTIHVDTVNQPPYFEPQFYQAKVPEKCNEDTTGNCEFPWDGAGITLTAFDRENSNLNCTLLWQELYYNYFALEGSCDYLVLNIIKTIDVDLNPNMQSINLTTTAIDVEGLEAMAYIQLAFYDINDHTPQFEQSGYSYQLDENTPGGVSLFQVFAEDDDLTSPNNEIRYSIEGALGDKFFKIDPDSGVVSTKQAVDFEVYPFIDFNIKAEDLGTPKKENTIGASVIINDLNDMHPGFECLNRAEDDPYPTDQNCFYNLELRSDTTIGYELVQLVAMDNDTISPDVFFLFLKPDSHFAIHDTNGTIESTRKMSDYTKYILYVYAEDRGSPNLISQTKVTIYALSDASTYAIKNLRLEKKFVHRDALLSKLRKNIHGTPSDSLIEHGKEFGPIRVMPTYPNWWLDTIEGIATICALCLLFVLLCITIALIICWKMETLCFGKKPDEPVKPKRPPTPIPDEFQMKLRYGNGTPTIRHRSAAFTPNSDGQDENIEEHNAKGNDLKDSPLTRKASVDTIHTLVYDGSPKPTMELEL
ncbi:hypothetical protein CAPTEDRAFT_201617 [Capitella teleta]|uniref:Cadherin domain-containing protein n=1 Tax=Capitella teleta TaxID=283909 RepID=R7V877_CAPTE|nr:hypothetical protein CAPTEDRAFT_201617 [Capitella teleta]|eukprot:ELU12571.1 hypothetical protein CAPTEDRAFT_201617 [Capitella teleta]